MDLYYAQVTNPFLSCANAPTDTDDEDSECKCGDEFASLGREMREVSLDG